MRPVAAVASVVVIAGGLYVAYRAFFPPPERRATTTAAIRVERLARPEGVAGAAVDVSARGDVRAAVWEDGSVTVRRGDAVARTLPPAAGEAFRRVAVGEGGGVVAVTARGRLYRLDGGAAVDLGTHVQAGSRIAAGAAPGETWAAGEAGGLRRLGPAPGDFAEVWETGAPPFTALLVDAEHAIAGSIEGTVSRGPTSGGPPSETFRLASRVTTLAAAGGWVAAGDEQGNVRVKRPRPGPSGATARVEGEVVGLALPVPHSPGGGEPAPLLVVHRPATATVLSGGAFEWHASTPLPSAPRAACAIDGGGALYAGTDDGEIIVRVVPAGGG